jgi:hypothetical protein
MKQFFKRQMSPELAHSERWRAGIGDRRAARLDRAYEEIVEGLEADDLTCAPLLRRTLDRSRGASPGPEEALAFVVGHGRPLQVTA